MKNNCIISPIITVVIIICATLLPTLTVFSGSIKKSILAQVVYDVTFPAYDSAVKGNIYFITIYNDNSVRVFIPNDSNGIYKEVNIPENKIKKIMEILMSSRITDDKYFWGRNYHVPMDGGSFSVEVYSEDKLYYLSSRLPLIEKQVNLVVIDKGEHILEKNETKEKYINEHASDDYKKFRKAWEQCFNSLDNLYLEITGEKIFEHYSEK